MTPEERWHNTEFPTDFYSAFSSLQLSFEQTAPQDVDDSEIIAIIDELVSENWDHYIPERMSEFASVLLHVVCGSEIKELKKRLAPYYGKIGENLELLVCDYGKIKIWLSGIGFILERDGERLMFPVVKGKIKDSVKSLAAEMKKTPEIVIGLNLTRQGLLKYILEKNTVPLHIEKCFSRLMDTFIEKAKHIGVTHAVQLAQIQSLRGESRSDDLFGIKVFEHEQSGIKLFWAYNKVVLVSKENGNTVSNDYPVANDNRIEQLKDALKKYAPLLFDKLPMSSQQIVRMIFAPDAVLKDLS